jgi:hypothetical protein
MKIFVRAFALALVATGAVASVHASNSATATVSAKVSMPPVPMCPPGDPNGCGIQNLGN